MFNIVLFQPEIPPNTGNIMRLCANTGSLLHLIEPLGFDISDKHLKRAGLDYILPEPLKLYSSLEEYIIKNNVSPQSIYLCSTKAKLIYTTAQYKIADTFVFGPETRGLPCSLLMEYKDSQKIKIPMQNASRSLNLSNAAAVIVYEAWRQLGFATAVF